MKPLYIAAAAAAAVAVVVVLTRTGTAPTMSAANAPADTIQQAAGNVAAPVAPPAAAGPPASPSKALPKSAGSAIGTAVAGIMVSNAVGDAVERVAGQGAGDVARINIGLAAPLLAKVGVQKMAEKLGAPPAVAKHAGITVAAGVVAGGPGVALKLTGEGASLAIRAIAGRKAEQTVRAGVRQFDPTLKGSVANTVIVKPVSGAVKAIKKLF